MSTHTPEPRYKSISDASDNRRDFTITIPAGQRLYQVIRQRAPGSMAWDTVADFVDTKEEADLFASAPALAAENIRLRAWLAKAVQMARQQAHGGEDAPRPNTWTWLADHACEVVNGEKG